MKRTVVIVGLLSIGLIILTSYGYTLYQNNNLIQIPNDYGFDFYYGIDFDYCGTQTAAKIEIQRVGNNINFRQILWIYCNANENNFKLNISNEGSIIIIREIFDDNTVTRCTCPIQITGIINNISSSFTALRFILDNKYVDQVRIIQTFYIAI